MNNLKHILERSFGIISINEALSIKYHDNKLELCITPLPGYTDEPISFLLAERDPRLIVSEISRIVQAVMYEYLEQNVIDIYGLIGCDL